MCSIEAEWLERMVHIRGYKMNKDIVYIVYHKLMNYLSLFLFRKSDINTYKQDIRLSKCQAPQLPENCLTTASFTTNTTNCLKW